VSLIGVPLAALAGGLTILSPCILPIAPIVLTSSLTQHKYGPAALACGLGLSFALVGVCLSLAEAAFGFDVELVKEIGALVMIGVGLLTFLPKSVDIFALATGPVSAWAGNLSGPFKGDGVGGQFALGALLALVWSPCAGSICCRANNAGIWLGRNGCAVGDWLYAARVHPALSPDA
jgi:cytochrome c-type biogenesis protein